MTEKSESRELESTGKEWLTCRNGESDNYHFLPFNGGLLVDRRPCKLYQRALVFFFLKALSVKTYAISPPGHFEIRGKPLTIPFKCRRGENAIWYETSFGSKSENNFSSFYSKCVYHNKLSLRSP